MEKVGRHSPFVGFLCWFWSPSTDKLAFRCEFYAATGAYLFYTDVDGTNDIRGDVNYFPLQLLKMPVISRHSWLMDTSISFLNVKINPRPRCIFLPKKKKKENVINFQFVTFVVNIAFYSVPSGSMITHVSVKYFLTSSCIFFFSISSETFNTYILQRNS